MNVHRRYNGVSHPLQDIFGDVIGRIGHGEVVVSRHESTDKARSRYTGSEVRMDDKISTENNANGLTAIGHPADVPTQKTLYSSVRCFINQRWKFIIAKWIHEEKLVKQVKQCLGNGPLAAAHVRPVQIHDLREVSLG